MISEEKLMIMPANNSSALIHYWAGKYPEQIGWLIGPSALPKTKLRQWIPFALDNDAFASWTSKKEWNEKAWIEMLEKVKVSGLIPKWVLVPDTVADRKATLDKWKKYAPIAAEFGWPLAFALQDGMTKKDIPKDCVLFVGGTYDWKWKTLPMWCETDRKIHVGRVNSVKKLLACERLGVSSVDGTGWLRGTENGKQATDLGEWLSGIRPQDVEMNF